MSTSTSTVAAAPPTTTPMRRVAIASCAGTTIEFYDFFIYGTAAALVFPTVFFPALGEAQATVASFATYGVAFGARPIGAALFGHFGDRLGRKRTLISTLMLMGVATVLIGCLPSADSIGVAAPILLVFFRFCQGFAVGGEWAGATLLAAEYAPPKKRGLYGVFPQLGPAFAFALSSATFLVVNRFAGETSDAFLAWGWRIPFLASALLVLVGLYVRLKVEETPLFRSEQTRASTQAPLVEALRHQWREVLLAGGALAMLFTFFYMGTAFLTAYGAGVGIERSTLLSLGICAALLFGLVIVVSGVYSDRIGRKKVVLASCAVAIPWGFVLFPILERGTTGAFAIGLFGTLAIFAVSYGPAGAMLPELFETRYRYTGAGIAYNLAGVVGGAAPPILATELLESGNTPAIGFMLAGLGALSLVCVLAMKESKDRSMA